MKNTFFSILSIVIALSLNNNAFALQVSRSIPEEPKPIEAQQPVKPDTTKKSDS